MHVHNLNCICGFLQDHHKTRYEVLNLKGVQKLSWRYSPLNLSHCRGGLWLPALCPFLSNQSCSRDLISHEKVVY